MTFDWKITGKKFLYAAIAVIIAGLASIYGNSPWFLAIAPILLALQNLIKHWNDE